MKQLVASLVLCGCAVFTPAAAHAELGDPVFVDVSPRTVPNCASAAEGDWPFTHLTAPFGAPFGGGVVRMSFNQPMAYGESHPDFYTDVPVTLADFTMPAGTVMWSFAAQADAAMRVPVRFICPAQGVNAFDVRLEFFPTPAPPVTLAGRGSRGTWSLLVVQLDTPGVLSLQAGAVGLAYRFDDAKAPTRVLPAGQTVALGNVSAGEHGLFVQPQTDVATDWSATFTTAASGGPSAGYGTGADPSQAAAGGGGSARPVLRKRPRITGVARVGRTVRCARGTYTGATRYTYRWLRGGKVIPRRTAVTYRLRPADRGRRVACEVRAANGAGAITVRSAAVQVRRAR